MMSDELHQRINKLVVNPLLVARPMLARRESIIFISENSSVCFGRSKFTSLTVFWEMNRQRDWEVLKTSMPFPFPPGGVGAQEGQGRGLKGGGGALLISEPSAFCCGIGLLLTCSPLLVLGFHLFSRLVTLSHWLPAS